MRATLLAPTDAGVQSTLTTLGYTLAEVASDPLLVTELLTYHILPSQIQVRSRESEAEACLAHSITWIPMASVEVPSVAAEFQAGKRVHTRFTFLRQDFECADIYVKSFMKTRKTKITIISSAPPPPRPPTVAYRVRRQSGVTAV